MEIAVGNNEGDGVMVGVGESVWVGVFVSVTMIDWVIKGSSVGEFVGTISGRLVDSRIVVVEPFTGIKSSSDDDPARAGIENRKSDGRIIDTNNNKIIDFCFGKRIPQF